VVDNSPIFFIHSNSLEAKAVDKKYFVEGYVATGDLDLGNDVITKGCIDSIFNQFEKKSLKLDFEHESLRGATRLDAEANLTKMPLGKRVKWARDEKGVKVGWELNPAWKRLDKSGNVTLTFQELWGAVENKFYDGFSIGYIPTNTDKFNLKNGETGRNLNDVKMLTTALTGTPMNPEANMTRAFAKSLEFMKEQEANSHSQKGDKMTDKQDVKPDEANDAKLAAEAKADENKDNLIEFKSKIETLEKESAEVKSALAEIKGLNTELKTKVEGLELEKAELKSIMEKAQHKAVQQSEVEQKEMKAKALEVEEKDLGNILGDL